MDVGQMFGDMTLDDKVSALRRLLGSTAANVTFRRRLRGFDRAEVRAFIGKLAGDYECAVRDLERVTQELDILQEKVSTTRLFPATTGEIEQILAGAARVAEEIRGKAEQERESLVAATRLRAAGIIKAARHRATESGRRAGEVIKAAEETREGAEEERRSIVAAADSRAVEVVKDAESRAREIVDHAADVSRASDEIREKAEEEQRSIIAAAEARRDEIVKEAEDQAHGIMGRATRQATLLGEQAETLRAQLLQMRATFESAASAAASAMNEIAEMEFEQERDVAEVSQPW